MLPKSFFQLRLFGSPTQLIKVPFAKEEVFRIVEQNATVLKSVPFNHANRYGRNEVPYFQGVVNEAKNSIDLIFNTENAKSSCNIRAWVQEDLGKECVIGYETYSNMYQGFWTFVGFVLLFALTLVLLFKQNWQAAKVSFGASLMLFGLNRLFVVLKFEERVAEIFLKMFQEPQIIGGLPPTLHGNKKIR
jgi:hypothetical protein